jgi:hypothetical protein
MRVNAMRVRYIVINEHTLGYLQPPESKFAGILRGSIIKGGDTVQTNGVIVLSNHTVRDATRADFEEYHVTCPPDFVDPPKASPGVYGS